VEIRDGDLVISLPGTITFASGSAKLTSRGEGILRRIVDEIRSRHRDRTISVEGHTDNDPIRKSKFETNWRLSVERAMAVRDYLEQSAGVDPDRFRVVGYGPFRPVASNNSSDGKEKNRRVEIVIVNT
jgi:chemotaxis protein MotB